MKKILLAAFATMIFATAPLSISYAAEDGKTSTTAGDKKGGKKGEKEPDCD